VRRAEKQRKAAKIEGGSICPKCKLMMQRFEHGPNWKPKASQPYFFRFWDICKGCRHIQHYEAAKTIVGDRATQRLVIG
jgi:hypothetical protein